MSAGPRSGTRAVKRGPPPLTIRRGVAFISRSGREARPPFRKKGGVEAARDGRTDRMPARSSRRRDRVNVDRLGGEERRAGRGDEGRGGDESVRMRDTADAEGPARTLALPPLSLPPRPSLAGAGAVAPHHLPGRAPTLPGRPARLQQAAVGESRGESAGEPHSYRPGTDGGGACRGGTLSALASARRACWAIASISARPDRTREVVAHALDHHQRGTGDRARGRPSAGWAHEPVGAAVDHERGRADADAAPACGRPRR